MKYEEQSWKKEKEKRERDVRIWRGEEVRNGMGGQTWVNLASERSHSA